MEPDPTDYWWGLFFGAAALLVVTVIVGIAYYVESDPFLPLRTPVHQTGP